MSTHPARVAILFTLASFLMQAAWIFAVPPFRGIDEFDHAFRASAVSRGQWLPSDNDAIHGRGNLQLVDRSIVAAAEPICESYKYTGPDNCTPVESVDSDTVVVATAAGRYHPLYYWMVGSPASLAEGFTALYVMRLVAAALCALFIGLAGWTTALWSRSRWPYVGIVVALSPVAIYSMSLPAPNGLEIAAGLSLWTALLGLRNVDPRSPTARLLILSCLPAAAVLSTVRQLGPLFLALIICVAIISYGGVRSVALARTQPASVTAAGVVVVLASAANLWWMDAAAGLTFDEGHWVGNPITESLRQMPAWLLQTVAAFPTRNEPAPAMVYAIWLIGFFGFVYVSLRRVWSRQHTALLVALAIGTAVPLALSIPTIPEHGPMWQGRYGLPFTVGIAVIAGLILDRTRYDSRIGNALTNVLPLGLITAHAVSVEAVLRGELAQSPLAGDPSWIIGYRWLPVALTVLGGLVLVHCAWRAPARDALHGVNTHGTGSPAESTGRIAFTNETGRQHKASPTQ